MRGGAPFWRGELAERKLPGEQNRRHVPGLRQSSLFFVRSPPCGPCLKLHCCPGGWGEEIGQGPCKTGPDRPRLLESCVQSQSTSTLSLRGVRQQTDRTFPLHCPLQSQVVFTTILDFQKKECWSGQPATTLTFCYTLVNLTYIVGHLKVFWVQDALTHPALQFALI